MDQPPAPSVTLEAQTSLDTIRWARLIGDAAQPGDVICLWGDVGAGKTFFARSLIQTLQSRDGTAEDVPSPTFTLIQTYDAGDLEIWHADLYRLGGPDEVIELGLAAAFDTAFCMIEWPDRLGDLMPESALHMTLMYGDTETARRCALGCADPDVLSRYTRHLKDASDV